MSFLAKIFRKNNKAESEPKKHGFFFKSKSKIIALTAMIMMLMNPASAADVNWTEITDVIDGFCGILPSFGAMVSAIMPILLVISIYVFIMKFWDKILSAIDGAFSHLGR
ncbi:hypothetical protein MSBRW_2507 [Methanosarcina barkeri str. Wiesmoor]|uniref:Uncharacterized protein n=2 Tax=Methanosarcina barkeri TaxID=2208 RepID=A0A0E3QPC1_METBA|nr:hypothetical protein [Methanosarcina barkeri]AKB51760.1 hypothetical protein MSBRW_2507 [Methanosarcina barkeri str. Wiesmoor]